MVASMPPPPGRGPRRGADWQQGNRRYAVIFLVVTVLIVSLYSWTKQRVEAEKRAESGRDRLCEVRAEIGTGPEECEEE